ncbi:hypothetical protein CL617_00115 [archaeon]|nr:hypothetical protein [archaeon]|tara:strand:+ start:1904 stop:2992 length:1089 start_codon:yes stop_codon:yes gene_type:complete
MSNSTLILPQDINDTTEDQRNELYIDKYGFTLDEILTIGRLPNDFNKIEQICDSLVYHYNFSNREKKSKTGAQLTLCTIGGLFREPWDGDYKRSTSDVRNILRRRYNSSGENLTTTHFLREEMNVYKGNLVELKEKNFQFLVTSVDLKESIRIPEEINFNEGMLIGIAYADAYVINDNLKNRNAERGRGLIFKGSNYDEEYALYTNILDMLKDQHNYMGEIKKHEFTTPNKFQGVTPSINVCSTSIATWYHNDLEFPTGNERNSFKLPKFNYEAEVGFFVGYVGAKARTGKYRNLRVYTKDFEIANLLIQMAEKLEIDYNYREDNNDRYESTKVLTIGKKGIGKMQEEDLLINPSHRNILLK